MNIRESLISRFTRYAAISSQSDAGAGRVPSSEGQRKLANLLARELKDLGLTDIYLSEQSVLTARLPENLPEGHPPVPKAGWVAHLDTVDAGANPDIFPVLVVNYSGGDICQNEEKGLVIRAADHPELARYIGEDILVSDGTSVLGADNKAAIANIMTALQYLKEHPEFCHGEIYVAFTPDEEIGLLGAKALELSRFPVDFAYTIDCCEEGELVCETFNAAAGTLRIRGVNAHPMSAKGVMVNAAGVAVDFVSLLDPAATMENTEGREGFISVGSISATHGSAEVGFIIRDHDREKFAQKKALLKTAADFLQAKYPKAEISLEIADTYANIADSIRADNRVCIDYLYAAMEDLGIKPKPLAMRGGTDGSFLSTKGILTPNYFTGAHNFHSLAEFLPVSAFEQSARVTIKLMELISGGKKTVQQITKPYFR